MSHPHAPHPHAPHASTHTGHAVEVVATFGGGVVGVRHVADPRGGTTRGVTRALLAAGATMLLGSALAFGHAARVASDNQAALQRWTDAGKPPWAFRPTMLPRALDGVMLGGSALGLVALTWGLARRRRERLPSRVRLGTARDADFACDGVGDAHDLIAPLGDGFVFRPAPGMRGELVQGGAARPLDGAPVPVTTDTRLRVQLGATTFHVGAVPAPARAGGAPLGLDRRMAAFVAASVAVHMGVLGLLRTVPDDQETGSGSDDAGELVALSGTARSFEEQVTEPDPTDDQGDRADPAGGQARMALESGAMGADAATPDPGRRKVASHGDPAVARHQALEAAKAAGILGSSFMQRGGAFASITGSADYSSGFDDLDQWGGWDGDGPGAPQGFGHGPSGWGPGGGGRDWNSVWVGDYNTISTGPGRGDGWELGGKDGRMRRKPAAPPFRIGKPDDACRGSAECDPEIIRRYIKRHASKIAYCYERQLLVTPGLAGTVSTVFTVMPNGRVINATASGVHDEVAGCMAGVIANIQFPKFDAPFQVKYPFHVRPAGS